MEQKAASESNSPETIVAHTTPEKTEPPVHPASDKTIGTAINFHTAEFNRRDGLDDCSGDYRFFEPLGNIVTADMHHQTERRLRGNNDDASAKDGASGKNEQREGRKAAVWETAQPLTVVSQGRILIIDTDSERAIACSEVLSGHDLTCTVLVKKSGASDVSSSRLGRSSPLEVNALSVTGTFGGFSAMVTVRGEQQPLTGWFGNEAALFDLVLDLQSTPSFSGGRLPLGYYAPGPNPAHLNEVMAELPEMRGQFIKPQFTVFQQDRCLHGRSRSRDCGRCIEVCSIGAIRTENHRISINHYLCQGCGGCALVCPADAIRMAHPPTEELLSALLRGMDNGSSDTASPVILVISEREHAGITGLPDGEYGDARQRVNFTVEQIGFVGMEMLLTALAYGAGQVVVVYGQQNPSMIKEAVARQVQMARDVLQGLGLRSDNIRFVVEPSENNESEKTSFDANGLNARPGNSLIPKAAFSPCHDKRALVRQVTQCLYDQSGLQKSWFPLPAGSPFGAVTVDTHCTFCMACAVTCPTGALSAGGDAPRLEFRESLCHQCSLCEETCPEKAIHLLPRMLCDPQAVETPVMLWEAEPFRCVECGLPFASQAMVERMRNKLAGHWMYADDRQLRRLQMCRTCRARDTLTSQDRKEWNRQ